MKKPNQIQHIEEYYQNLMADNNSVLPHSTREKAKQNFATYGLPTVRQEDWKYTPINHLLTAQPISLENTNTDSLQIDGISEKIVISLSNKTVIGEIPQGLSISFKVNNPNQINAKNEKLSSILTDDGLLFLNQSYCQLFVEINLTKNTIIEKPIFIDYGVCQTENKKSQLKSSQISINCSESSECTLIQYYRSPRSQQELDLNSCLFDLKENSKCSHFAIQPNKLNNQQFAYYYATLDKYAQLTSYSMVANNIITRRNFVVDLIGNSSFVSVNSAYYGRKEENLDTRTIIRHLATNCQSEQLHQGLLEDSAKGVFNGMIYVSPEALKTDGQMDNNVILLSKKAQNNSKPQLEIYADDVKCSHGFTCGSIDKNQMFYMKSRGIPEELARQQILKAFMARITENFPDYLLETVA